MVRLEINGKEVVLSESLNLLEACNLGGAEIPRFCYHSRLSVAGNCRMCLVEVKNAAKPVASCAVNIVEGMVVSTNTHLVKKAREGVMEFLLANHPLDCPICDQGGECDLQDQAMAFGSDRGRFYEFKRATKDKDIGPLVKTIMTRCIHCTRCVRFSNEVSGTAEFGVTGRGNSMEIGTYISKIFISEVSGNIIDLCPVGALTSKAYAFNARPWELLQVTSIDLFDALGSNILVEVRGQDILRVLPLLNEDLNDEWITDKVRFCYDGFKKQRLVSPLEKVNSGLVEVSWERALSIVLRRIYSLDSELLVTVGDFVDLESLIVLKDFINRMGYDNIYYSRKLNVMDIKEDYLLNTPVQDVLSAEVCLIVGSNIRLEMPVLAVKLRQAVQLKSLLVVTIGSTVDYFFKSYNIGSSLAILLNFLQGNHFICSKFSRVSKPLFFFGALLDGYGSIIQNSYGLLERYVHLRQGLWDGRNTIFLGCSAVGVHELGFRGVSVARNLNLNKVVYSVNGDNLEVLENNFMIYQGSHGDKQASEANLVLPSFSFFEEEGLFINNLGHTQKSKFITDGPRDARSNWCIFRALQEYMLYFEKKAVMYSDLDQVRKRLYSLLPSASLSFVYKTFSLERVVKPIICFDGLINSDISDFYLTDSISRSSKLMGECSLVVDKLYANYKWEV